MDILKIIALIILGVIALAMIIEIMDCCKVSSESNQDVALSGVIVAVDFDNTLAITKYPEIIEPINTTIEVIQDMKRRGAIIILWTCREGKELEDAVDWCNVHNVPIDYVNENVPERIKIWGNDCRKIGADIYIDDKAMNRYMLRPRKNRE